MSGESKFVVLNYYKISTKHKKSNLIELQIMYRNKHGNDKTRSEKVWIPHSQTETLGHRIKITRWICQKKEEEIAKKYGYKLVEIVCQDDDESEEYIKEA